MFDTHYTSPGMNRLDSYHVSDNRAHLLAFDLAQIVREHLSKHHVVDEGHTHETLDLVRNHWKDEGI